MPQLTVRKMSKITELKAAIGKMSVMLSGTDCDGNEFLIGYQNPQAVAIVDNAVCFERQMRPDEFLAFAKEVRANAQESTIKGNIPGFSFPGTIWFD